MFTASAMILKALMWEKAGLVRMPAILKALSKRWRSSVRELSTSVSAAHHVSTPNGKNG